MATPKKNYARDNVPLSRFGVLAAQLESIVASAAQQSPDPLLCFDLLSDLISAIDDEPKDSILLWQRKCEDVLYSLLVLGARRPVRHLASVAMARVLSKGDPISIYSRASSLQGFLSDGKKNEPQRVAGAAQCLGELYHFFGRKITSGLAETSSIVSKLMKSHEEYVRKEALYLLQNALEGCGGLAAAAAYTEAFRLITRFGVNDKAPIVRIAAARCLKAFANVGGPGLGVVELDASASLCVKAFSDPVSSVRDAFAEALGALLALGMNPEAQVQPRGKGQFPPAKKLEGGLHKHLVSPFVKASGLRFRETRLCLTLAWVSFLQAILLKYLHPDSELQDFASSVLDMLRVDTSTDTQALACVLYILRVAVVDQMTEPTQRNFLVVLGRQLQSPDFSSPMKVAALRTLSYTLKTVGEVPVEFREILDDTVVVALSHPSQLVRIEAALTMRALAEVDPTCVSGLVSYGVTMLSALRESVSFEKGSNFKVDLDSLDGQATLLAALVSISPRLPLGYPARLPHSVLEVSKKMLTGSSRNPGAVTVVKEAGWLLLASLVASIPKEELEDHVFDILALWAPLFSGNPELEIRQNGDWTSKIRVWSAAIDALTAFIKCFVSSQAANNGILIQPVLVYLSSALSHISFIAAKDLPGIKPVVDVLIIRTLTAFQSLSDPMAYKSDHPKLLQLCTAPFRDPSAYEESSCLRLLLDKRDAWLGPWIPGRDWFEDELRAFQGGKDGLMPCVWDTEVATFPQPESVSKMLVNQMLLCFGLVFAFQDSVGMQSLLGVIEQCFKTGKRQAWHASSVNNICVGLLSGLKALLSFRPQPLGSEILNLLQNIFQSILAEGDISPLLRRASSEGLGLLTRLADDIFTARMTKLLLADLAGTTDANYAGSMALALGCIHRSAGGMALSSLVPPTVSSISALAKSSMAGLQIWSLHGLLLTIEAAGLSYVSHVQGTLNLGLEILLSEENESVELQQGVGRLINAIVAVLGPELAPGSIFFSRCKSAIAEISSCEETTTLLESVRFTQQLVLFAPQALSVHSHVQTLIPTLSSRQPTLRHLAISTLRHLIEKDSVSVIHEQIEESLFHMLDEETDAEIGKLVRSTIMRLLYASSPSYPSHWISICRKLVLAMASRDSALNISSEQGLTNSSEGDTRLGLGEDDENMVSSSRPPQEQGYLSDASSFNTKREKHLRYRTRVFAAECLSHLPTAVGNNPAHFDSSLAREQKKGPVGGDWLVLQLQELISLAYQISTSQFENMRLIGVVLLSTLMDRFEEAPDPELPGCLLLEQYQAQLVSALRSALDMSSGPILLEAGLQLATKLKLGSSGQSSDVGANGSSREVTTLPTQHCNTDGLVKILISGIIRGDQAAVKRIFSLISQPLDHFEDFYYPSFAEWVSCKIKVRLLAAHASLKCHTYTFLRRHHIEVPDEYMALLPLFSKISNVLGNRWIGVLKDHCYLCFNLHVKKNWKPFLEGIKSPLVSSKLKSCLEEAWPVILQAVALDAAPINANETRLSDPADEKMLRNFMSGYSMVELGFEDFQFLWGFALLILFQGCSASVDEQIIPLAPGKSESGGDALVEETKPLSQKLYEIVLPIFQSLCAKKFFCAGFLTVDICRELLQVFSYVGIQGDSWSCLAVAVLAQIIHCCPDEFLKISSFADLVMELCLAYLYKHLAGSDAFLRAEYSWDDLISQLFTTAKTLVKRFESEKQLKSILAFMLAGYKCARVASTEKAFSKINEFVLYAAGLLKNYVEEKSIDELSTIDQLQRIIGACSNSLSDFLQDCIEAIHLLENKTCSVRRLVYTKLAFCLEQMLSFAGMVFKMKLHQEECFINVSIFICCTRSIQLALMDTNVQVQAIGLQVLKNTIQKISNSARADPFLLILTGELFREILMVIQKIIAKPVTRESTALAGECLKTLVLMQTLPKGVDCQQGLMKLLLEAVVMILSETEGSPSQEASELRSTAVRIVSHVAQVPSVAVHLREVLLGMPGTHRQQIQGIIRASVMQEHQTTLVKSSGLTLEIKLPRHSGGGKEESPPASPLPPQSDEEYEDEDDWDAFQSFPTSSNTVAADSGSNAENCSIYETNTENDVFLEVASHLPSDDLKVSSEHHQNAEKEEICVSHESGAAVDGMPLNSEQQGSSTKESDEVNLMMGNLMKSSQTDSEPVGEFTNSINVEVPASSEDPEASRLEAAEHLDGDQSLKFIGDSEANGADGKDMQLSGRQGSFLESQDIAQNVGSNQSPELPETGDKIMKPATHEVVDESRERTSTVGERYDQRKEISDMPGSSEAQGLSDRPALPVDEDIVKKPESAKVASDSVERTEQNQDIIDMSESSETEIVDESLEAEIVDDKIEPPEDSSNKTPAESGVE